MSVETGNTLRKWREGKGMSQLELAEKLNKSKAYVSRKEAGLRTVHGVEIVAWGEATGQRKSTIDRAVLANARD